MATTELSEDELRVLRALQTVHDRDLPPTTHIVAELVGSTFRPTRRVINMLFERGLVTGSLTLTDDGRRVLGLGRGDESGLGRGDGSGSGRGDGSAP